MKSPALRVFGLLAILVMGVILLVVGAALLPLSVPSLPERTGPAESLAEVEASTEVTPTGLNPVCRARVLTHGSKTPVAYVLLHGLSNCPSQFEQLGQALHATGSNVFIPLLPDHGMLDRLTPDYGRMTLEDLADWAVSAVRSGQALGEKVVVVGLSISGTTALWLAMDEPGVERAVILAPFLGPAGMPEGLNAPLGRLLARMPNMFVWWNSELREANPGPPQAYPGFPTRLVGRFMVLGSDLLAQIASRAPACKDITLIASEADAAISLPMVRLAAAGLSAHPGVRVREVWFPAEEKVPHDFVDPLQPDQQTERLDPLLVKWITSGAAGDASGQ